MAEVAEKPQVHPRDVENAILRDFYDAWVFFHATKNDPSESPTWNQTRQKMAAQALVDAAGKVDRWQKLNRKH